MSTVFVAVVLSVKKICLTINLCLRLLTSTRWHQTCGKKELPHGMLNTREWEGVTIFLSLLLCIGQIEASTCPPPGKPPGIWLFWKLVLKIPPTRAKMPFKCPTLGSIQVIKCLIFLTVYEYWMSAICIVKYCFLSEVCRYDKNSASYYCFTSDVMYKWYKRLV